MKRILSIIASIIIFLSAIAYGADLQNYAFPFTGRWNPTENPLLLDDYGLQDIQNLRKDGKHFKGVSGHTVINSTSLSSYPYILNGFHFRKDQPSESYVIVYAADSITPTGGRLYQNTTAIPGTGNFSSTVLYTPTAFNNPWRFAKAPAGNMIAANGDGTLIWGGNEIEAVSFVTSSADITYTLTNSNDYSTILSNTRQTTDQIATLLVGGGNDVYTKLLLHGDGADASTTFTDSSSGAKAVTVNNVTTEIEYYKFGNASGYFNGVNAYLSLDDSADWNFGAGDFTIDFWVNYTGTYGVAFGQHTDANNRTRAYLNDTTGHFSYWWKVGGVTRGVLSCASPSTSTWHHIAIVRNGNTLTLYIDGTSSATADVTGLTYPDLTGVFTIGAHNSGGGVDSYYTGYIDEFRVSKGIARWTSNFTVATQPYGNASNYFLIGSKRPLQGVKFYVSSGNTVASTLTVKEWQGTAWTTLTATDNTDTGPTLAQTGTVTWTATGNAKTRYINGLSLYWYKFYFDAGQASLYYVTTDAPITTIKNIWDGSEGVASKVLKYDGTTYKDYTDETADSSAATYADLSSLANTHAVYIGFLEPQQALSFKFVTGSENSNASVLSAYYWNGSDWTSVGSFYDATDSGGKTFAKGGVVSFQAATPGTEFQRSISDESPLYYYKLTVSASLDADVKISEIRGVPSPPVMSSFKFADLFQNRTLLCNEPSGDNNKCIYSVYNAPDIFNGDDSGDLYFGDKTEVTASAVLYNVFLSAGYDQLLVYKKNETYRVYGDGPDNWITQRISGRIGCIAPLSVAVAEVADVSQDVKRNVAIWVSDKGVVMSDGATITSISEDIKVYWDANDSRAIPDAYAPKAVGWYDPKLQSYKLLIASGSTATYLNTELEYSLKYKEWTKVYRENASGANPLQSGFEVFDTNGIGHTYGGGKDGFVYRLENGNNWNSTANIASYLHTKDLILDNQTPLFRQSLVKYLRTTYEQKNVGNITVTHYGDRTATTTGVNGQFAPSVITNASTTLYDTQSVNLGPFLYHSFKFSATTNVADGMELTGMGVYFSPLQVIR